MTESDPISRPETESARWDAAALRAGGSLSVLVTGWFLLSAAGVETSSLVVFSFLGSLVTGVLGSVAVRRLKRRPKETRARGLGVARAANTVGYIVLLSMLYWACAWPSLQ